MKSVAVAVVAGLGVVGLIACGEEARVAVADAPPERTCPDRAEGGVIQPVPVRDSIAGSASFYNARSNFFTTLNDLERRDVVEKWGWTAIKILALVKAGDVVDVVVPNSQRRWLALEYLPNEKMGSEIRFVPCERLAGAKERMEECEWKPVDACRSGITQFNGAIVVNFTKAPRNGRCARIRVSNDAGGSRSLYLFSDPESCLSKRSSEVWKAKPAERCSARTPLRGNQVLLACAEFPDSRQFEVRTHRVPGTSGNCLELYGYRDRHARSCGYAPSERQPSTQHRAIKIDFMSQFSRNGRIQVFGSLTPRARKADVLYELPGGISGTVDATIAHANDKEALRKAGISKPFAYFSAEIPRNSARVRVRALGKYGNPLGAAGSGTSPYEIRRLAIGSLE